MVRVCALGLSLLLASSTAFAQVSSTTGSINGKVTDSSGGVLPGVTVTATSPEHAGQPHRRDQRGRRVSLSRCPPGTYKLVYELGGFGTVNREGVSGRPRVHGDREHRAGRRQPAGDRHGQRRIAGGRRVDHDDGLELRRGAARRAAQRARLLDGADGRPGGRRDPHRRRRQRRRHADRLRRLRHQGRPAPADGRGHRQHRGHQRRRLLLRLRLDRRGGGADQGPHRRDAVAGRVVELRVQVGRQRVPRQDLRRLPEQVGAEREHPGRVDVPVPRRPLRQPDALRPQPDGVATTTSTPTSAATSSRTRSGGISRPATRTSRPRCRTSR